MPRPSQAIDVCDLRRSVREPEFFARVYDAHSSAILRFLARRTFDVEVARDLTAETFALAFEGRRRFRGTSDGETAAWLYGIARHLLGRHARNGLVERRATRRLGIAVPDLADGDHERTVELAGLADARASVAGAFERLPADQREAVRLRVVEELSYAEVAKQLGVSEPTARARVSRGLRRLAAGIDDNATIKEAIA